MSDMKPFEQVWDQLKLGTAETRNYSIMYEIRIRKQETNDPVL